MDLQEQVLEVLENIKNKEVDYVTEQPHLLVDTTELLNTINVLSCVVDLSTRRNIFKGLSIKTLDEHTIEIINVSELYYFKNKQKCFSNIKEDVLFLDLVFIQKIIKFLPNKTLIYENGDKYYIRLITGDLELLNPIILETDLHRLECPYNDFESVKDVDLKCIEGTLEIYTKLLQTGVTAKKKVLNSKDNLFSYIADTNVKALCPSDFVDIELRYKDVNYLSRLSKTFQGGILKISKVKDSILQRYCFEYNDMLMLSNFANPKEDKVVLEKYSSLPELTVIDIEHLLFLFSYIHSITYSTGTLSLEVIQDKLLCRIHLTNGSYANVVLKNKTEIKINNKKPIVIKSKVLYDTISSFDKNLETGIGYKEGILYIVNKDITVMLVTG